MRHCFRNDSGGCAVEVMACGPRGKGKEGHFTRLFQNCLSLKQVFYTLVRLQLLIESASELWQCKLAQLSLFKRKEITFFW